jgi:ParB-like chromosome segregation protein Spo0J
MAARKPAKTDATSSLAAMGLEKYTVETVHRSALKSAPYNPRILSNKERASLKRGIRRHGIVSPPTWNRRSGNIVGGHQRVSVLDSLAGTPDYELTVAVVDIDDKSEREINILLNNPGAQGDWNLEKLGALLQDNEVKLDIDATGFDVADVYKLFGDSPFEERPEQLAEMGERLREVVEATEKAQETARARDSAHFYLVVVFRDDEDRVEFTSALGLEDNRYVDGRELRRLLGKPHADDA